MRRSLRGFYDYEFRARPVGDPYSEFRSAFSFLLTEDNYRILLDDGVRIIIT